MFVLQQNPSVIVSSSSSSSNSSSNSSSSGSSTPDHVTVVVKQPLLCKTSLGIPQNCSFTVPPDPTYDAQNKMCNDVTLEVRNVVMKSNLLTLGVPSNEA